MNAVLDVFYRDRLAWAACVTFDRWVDARPRDVFTISLQVPAEYEPGHFYKRELPCLLAVLENADQRFEHIVIDSFVSLKPPLLKGLGARLAESLDACSAVIGVAKSSLKIADRYVEIRRGNSLRPLYVSSVNCPIKDAVTFILSMHGQHRIPTLIGMADQAARAAAKLGSAEPRRQSD